MFYPAIICLLAGLSTGLGALPVISGGGIDRRKMGFSSGFAAGVMVYISLADLLPESFSDYREYLPGSEVVRAVLCLFVCGLAAGAALCSLPLSFEKEDENGFFRRGAALTWLVMVLHNLPEGMLTMFTGAWDISFGAKTALAVALHNLPEGMAVAAPVLYCEKSRMRAFLRALAAGLAEPVGGIIAFLVLKDRVNLAFISGFLPVTAGIMCRAAAKELLPSAVKAGGKAVAATGFALGALVMAAGLMLF